MLRPIITHDKPVHEHDCDACIYLGTYTDLGDKKDKHIDCYWCKSRDNDNLHSVIGRHSSEGSDYASSHPPEAFAEKQEYLKHARSWYLFALIQASRKGLYQFAPIK